MFCGYSLGPVLLPFAKTMCPSFSNHTHKLSLEKYTESLLYAEIIRKISHRLDQLYSHKLMTNVKESFLNLRFCCLNFLFLTEIYGWPKEMCFLIIVHKPSWWSVKEPLWALVWPSNILFLVVFTVSWNITSVTNEEVWEVNWKHNITQIKPEKYWINILLEYYFSHIGAQLLQHICN